MKKIFVLILMGLVGFGLVFSNLKADESNRTIPMKSGVALGAKTLITGHSGTLYKVTGFASSANAGYSVHNVSSIDSAAASNTLCEGGEATQYDSFDTIDFGPEGIEFSDGLGIHTTTCRVCVLYR